MSESLVIDVAAEKVAAKVKTEDGKIYEILSPTLEVAKDFEKLLKEGEKLNPEDLLLAYSKIGLPIEVGKKLPMKVLKKIGESLSGDQTGKK